MAQLSSISTNSFYSIGSPPKKIRLQDCNSPEPIKSPIITTFTESPKEESRCLGRDSPLPLKNLGNTCYENSIIQCLFSLEMFMDKFTQSMETLSDTVEQPDFRYRISNAFYNLYRSYTKSLKEIDTFEESQRQERQRELESKLEELKSAVGERSSQFNSTHQQDASEFFYHVIDSIQEFYQSLNKTNDYDNPVTETFELELDYMIRCPGCDHKIISESEKVRTLPLALPQVSNENAVSAIERALGDALNNYFKDDILEFRCSQPQCESLKRKKQCLIRKLPQVLFITLARYSYSGKKDLDEIEAPFELSVPFQEYKSPSHSPSIHNHIGDDDNNYQLVAVVCHLGSSLDAGHYTSYVYNQNNSSWYSCDDDSITKVLDSEVKTNAGKSGYCFFYAHKSCIISRKSESVVSSSASNETASKESADCQPTKIRDCMPESSVVMTPESSPSPSAAASEEASPLESNNLEVSNKL